MKSLLKTIRFAQPAFFKPRSFATVVPQQLDPYQEEALNEKLILVDENDQIIGTDTKRNCHRVKYGKIPLHRAFSAFIFNSKNELLLQERASSKVTYPNHLTNSCCSHPLYDILVGRDNLQNTGLAVQRRLTFELGIPISEAIPNQFKFITKIHYFSEGDGTWGEHEIDYIYIIRKDFTLVPNPMEIGRIFSVSRADFNSFIKSSGLPLTPWFELIIKNWLFKWWDNLDNLKALRDDKIHRYH